MIPADHPQRRALNDEVHARPTDALIAPARLSYLVLFSDGDRERENAAIRDLIDRHKGPALAPGQNHYGADLGPFRLTWERHSEFVRYTFIVNGAETAPFADPAINAVPKDWLAALPGRVLTAIHGALIPGGDGSPKPDVISESHFAGNVLIGARIAGGAGTAFTDFRIHPDGFGRVLIRDEGMTPRQAGRCFQRLLETDTYRVMALLALPVARELTPIITQAGGDLLGIITEMQSAREEDEPVLLDKLTRLDSLIERYYADSHYRFSAANAYYDLVQKRVEELREQRIEGLQTFREFNDRRLSPAVATCRAASARLAALSERVDRTTVLLSTRVNVTREKQNQAVLKSMDRRADLQLRLQQTVEGLSVAAITYYIVGIIGYGAKGLKAAGLGLNTDVITGLSIPIVAALVAFGLRRFHKSLHGNGPH